MTKLERWANCSDTMPEPHATRYRARALGIKLDANDKIVPPRYMPHQGKRECARRVRQREALK